MEYIPVNSVWEITMACNMRCGHCGSQCTDRHPDELTNDEALQLCDDLAELGLKVVTLSGGEPLMRPDWADIAKRLSQNGIIPNIISNGWLVDDAVIDKALDAGINTIAVSLDGTSNIHDTIRKKGSFDRVMKALEAMQKRGFASSVATTVMKLNLPILPELKKIIQDKGVVQWQFQLGMPMGNLGENKENVVEPAQINDVIDFVHDVMKEGKIRAYLADNIGYYTNKSVEINQAITGEETAWSGCSAGKNVIGILHDGRITGCTSLRDESFIEGSIRETPLKELWSRHGAFAWNRDLSREKLTGFCKKCRYGDICLGGCSTLKWFTSGTLNENSYCAYRISVEKLFPKINRIQNVKTLMERAEKSISLELYELAEMCLTRALEISPKDENILNMLGYIYFQIKDYDACLKCNKKALAISPKNSYSMKGLGLCLTKLGRIEEGIDSLKKSIAFADNEFMDPYYDLAVVLFDIGQIDEAINILEKGRNKSEKFIQQSEELYNKLKKSG